MKKKHLIISRSSTLLQYRAIVRC